MKNNPERSMKNKSYQNKGEPVGTLVIKGDTGGVSDGYHAFDELYEHQHQLFIAFMHARGRAWRSKKHADGSMFEGWFVAGIKLPAGMITYHLPEHMWNLCNNIDTLEFAPEWDGHIPADVVSRLNEYNLKQAK